MYAVFQTGGKQYRVSEGDVLRVESLEADEGASLDFDTVLLVSDGETTEIGKPYVAGGRVSATVTGHGRGDKITIVHFRRRKHSRKQMGHRQNFTELKITGIAKA